MKFLFISFLCLTLFANNIYSQQESNNMVASLKKDDNKEKLILGGNLGIGGVAYCITDIISKNKRTALYSKGFSNDLLSEYSAFVQFKTKNKFGYGLELGRMTHFEYIMHAIYQGEISRVERFISGFYFAPFFSYSDFKFGFTFMAPEAGSYFDKFNDDLSLIIHNEDLNDKQKEVVKSLINSYTNIFMRYDYELSTVYHILVDFYGKLSYNLSNPLTNGMEKNYDISKFRIQITIGFVYTIDALQ